MQIKEKLNSIQQRIASFATKEHHPQLIAVSKAQDISKITELLDEGWLDFGENYLQELEKKSRELSMREVRWHFIGQLQSRKISSIVKICSSIHCLDSEKHALKIQTSLETLNRERYPVFIAVNSSGEQQKSGIAMESAKEFADFIEIHAPRIEIQGIMTVPAPEYSDENYAEVPELYVKLRELADAIGKGRLSLGMSRDLRIATQCGTDIVRIGTDIFGKRM